MWNKMMEEKAGVKKQNCRKGIGNIGHAACLQCGWSLGNSNFNYGPLSHEAPMTIIDKQQSYDTLLDTVWKPS